MNAKGYPAEDVPALPDDSPAAKTKKARLTVRPALPDAHADVALGDLKDVCSIIRMGPSWVHAEVAAGRFPQPLRWGPRCTRWPISVVRNWLLERRALAEADTEAATFVKMRAAKASAAAKQERAARAASAGEPPGKEGHVGRHSRAARIAGDGGTP